MTTIDGAVLTSEMVEQIREWQKYDYIDDDIRTIEKAIDLILERDDVKKLMCKEATKYLHLFSQLRDLSKNLSKFKLKNEDEAG